LKALILRTKPGSEGLMLLRDRMKPLIHRMERVRARIELTNIRLNPGSYRLRQLSTRLNPTPAKALK
jgi:hypothetical protein